MHQNEELLHSKGLVGHFAQTQREAMLAALRCKPAGRLSDQSPGALAESLFGRFSINVPVLDEGAIESRGRLEIKTCEGSGSTHIGLREPHFVAETDLSIYVPFAGDAELFWLHAKNCTVGFPCGEISYRHIIYRERGRNLDPEKLCKRFQAWLECISEHLQWMQHELQDFNENMRVEIREEISRLFTEA